jgi:uncharacterized membrane protein YkgB
MSAFPIPTAITRYVTTVAQPSIGSLDAKLRQVEASAHRWLIAHSIAILRISIGLVLVAFGALKFFPGVSPAQDLVEKTTSMLTLGLVPGATALVGVALLETIVGLWLISGRGLRGAVYLLSAQLVGIMSPLVLLPGRLFAGPHGAPTLEGQYVLKDVIIVGAALVLVATLSGARLAARSEGGQAAV